MSSFYAGNEVMGVDVIPSALLGLTWKAQLAEKIFSETGDKKLKSWHGEHNWNVALIDRLIELSARELLRGADKITAMSANANVSKATAESFFRNVDQYRNKKMTASVVSTGLDLAQKLAEGAGDLAKGAGGLGKSLPWIVGILAVGVGGYLVLAGRKGVNLMPKLP